MNIRCSQLPLLDCCAASAHSRVSINTTSEAAETGTLLHRQISDFISGKPVTVSDELDWFKSAWLSLNVDDVEAEVEVSCPHDGIIYSGHIDAVCNHGNLLIDWKTGRGETDYRPQMIGYAYLWLRSRILDPKCGEFGTTIAVINTTTKTVWSESLTSDQVAAEFLKIHRKIKYWNGQYNVGDHCKYCPARDFCYANLTKINNSLELLGQPGMVGKVDTDRLVEVYPLIGQMESRLKFLKDFVKDQVCLAGGKIESLSGTLELQQVNRAEVSVTESASWLIKLIGREKLYDLLKLGIGDLERAVIEWFKGETVDYLDEVNPLLTKRDKKGVMVKITQDELKKWLRESLAGIDALTTTTTQKLNFKPAKKEITGD